MLKCISSERNSRNGVLALKEALERIQILDLGLEKFRKCWEIHSFHTALERRPGEACSGVATNWALDQPRPPVVDAYMPRGITCPQEPMAIRPDQGAGAAGR